MTLIIKETTPTDLDNILDLWNCPEVMHFVGFPDGLQITKPELETWYNTLQTSTRARHYSIYDNETYCGETFYRLNNDGSSDVDIKLTPSMRGRSIASTALSFILSIVLFDHKVSVAKVDPHPDNTDAINLYTRLGFKRVEGTTRDMHVTLDSFKPCHQFLKKAITLKTVPFVDYPRLWELSSKEDWYPYCDTNAPYFYEYTPYSYEEFLIQKQDKQILGIYFRDTLIGEINHYWEHQQTRWLEIGLVLYDEHYWGKGIGTHCLNLQADALFTRYPEIQRVGFVTWSGNIGMQRSGDKAYFKKEAVLRQVRYFEGTYYDSIRYGLTREEWTRFNRASVCRQIFNPHEKMAICDRLLHKNPHHFGIEESIQTYIKEVLDDVVFTTPAQDGFISIKHCSETTLEINVMALDPDIHHQGFGTQLVNCAIMYGRKHGYQNLLVMTLADSHPDIHYQKTRCFYEALGFKKTQVFRTIWGEANPCQEYLLVL